MPYRLLIPKSSNADKKAPLLLILHGMGDDGVSYLELWKDEAERHQTALLAPTLKRNYSNTAEDLKSVYDLVEHVIQKYPIDAAQIRIAGISAGGVLAQWLVMNAPQRWKDAVFLSAPPMSEDVRFTDLQLKSFPSILYVYGEKDEEVSPEALAASAHALKARGVIVGMIEDPDAGHAQRSDWARYIFQWFDTHTLETSERQSTQ